MLVVTYIVPGFISHVDDYLWMVLYHKNYKLRTKILITKTPKILKSLSRGVCTERRCMLWARAAIGSGLALLNS